MTPLVDSPSCIGALLAVNWGDILVPAVVFVVWIINQIAAAKKAGNAQPPPRRPMPPPAAGGAANAPQPQGRGGLMNEVEQFLRQARQAMEDAQKPKKQPPRPQPLDRPQTVPQKTQSPRPQQAKQANRGGKQQAKKSQPPSGRKPPVEQPRTQPRTADRSLGGGVAAHVEQHFDTSRFEERAGRLSHLKQHVEHDIGDHVHQALDHQLGNFAAQAAPTNDSPPQPDVLTDLIGMLRSPQNMRAAFLMQEILVRPTTRWK